MTELQIQRCDACATAWFPERLRCPSCGSADLDNTPAGEGSVEEETTLRRTANKERLGSVRLDAGPVVIARLDEGVTTGARVRLDTNGAIRARHSHL